MVEDLPGDETLPGKSQRYLASYSFPRGYSLPNANHRFSACSYMKGLCGFPYTSSFPLSHHCLEEIYHLNAAEWWPMTQLRLKSHFPCFPGVQTLREEMMFALIKNKKLHIGALNKIFKQVLKCG